MDIREITEKVNLFLVNEIEIEEGLISPEASLKEDLGIDSLDVVDIVVLVEQVFGIKIKGQELRSVKTLKDFYAFIEKKLN